MLICALWVTSPIDSDVTIISMLTPHGYWHKLNVQLEYMYNSTYTLIVSDSIQENISMINKCPCQPFIIWQGFISSNMDYSGMGNNKMIFHYVLYKLAGITCILLFSMCMSYTVISQRQIILIFPRVNNK